MRLYIIDILKFIMVFSVVGAHFGAGVFPFSLTGTLAVPVFMILSFIFFGYQVHSKKNISIKGRIKRIYIPYVIWSIVYIYIYGFIYFFLGDSFYEGDWKSVLFLQITFGHTIVTPLWFSLVLLILTILFYFITVIIKNDIARQIVYLFLLVLSIVLQYTELNYKIFCDLQYEIRYSLGRIIEMVPYASLGMLISNNIFNIKNRCGINESIFICLGSILFFCIAHFCFSSIENCFSYAGMGLLLKAICTVLFFWFLPIKISTNKWLELMVKYNMGIYFIHMLIGTLFTYYFNMSYGLVASLLVFIISYLVCFIFDKLSKCNLLFLFQ